MVQQRTYSFEVEDCSAGVRLDTLITSLLPEVSRNRAQKLIGAGMVTVNDRAPLKRYVARPSDILRITIPSPEEPVFEAEDIPLKVLYEDDELMAVLKPPGMVIHPAPGHRSGTLINALLHRSPLLSSVGGPGRPGIVHRLDKDTSGIVIVAKTDTAHRRVASLFARRAVSKTYLAAAAGSFRREEGTWDTPIGRDRKDRKKISSRTGRPRAAVTHWRLLSRLDGASLLEMRPETGRTHQIRVHLAESGHPVLGDVIYGPKPRAGSAYHRTSARYGFGERLALHAWKLRFRHPATGEALSLEAPLPQVFRKIMPS
jgi:23S rRNA pseudouridine1911/1915/1917 synthase